MKIKYVFKFVMLSFIFFLNGCSYRNENPNMELTGNIIMPTPNLHFGGDDSFVGLLIFDVKNKQGKIVFEDKICGEPSCNKDKNKVLCVDFYDYLYEYNLDTGEYISLLDKEELIHHPQYIPNTNCISYIKFDKLIIYNLETKNKKEIDNVLEYSWSKDGKSFIYNKFEDGNGFIFKYDLENNTSIKLFEGRTPIYSADNNYMAYFNSKDEDKRSEIIVRNLKTGEEKSSEYDAIHNFKFSPESDKIAYTKTSGIYESDLVVWDYKTDEHCVLIEKIVNDCGFDWK